MPGPTSNAYSGPSKIEGEPNPLVSLPWGIQRLHLRIRELEAAICQAIELIETNYSADAVTVLRAAGRADAGGRP